MDKSDVTKRFNNYISTKALKGYIVVDKNESEFVCVLSKPAKKMNHVLHLILTIITFGMWFIVWIVLYFTSGKETRVRGSFDSTGNLVEEKM